MPRAPSLNSILEHLRRPMRLTWGGMIAERLVHAFWPVWVILALLGAALMLGLHDSIPAELVWALMAVAAIGFVGFSIRGALRFRWPSQQDAIDRLDQTIKGRPLAALSDRQAIGQGDHASESLWVAHLERMAARASGAKTVQPDLNLTRKDPFGLRYVALLGLVVALLFGSVLRVGSVTQLAPASGVDLTTGPSWEGWIEPPAYTGLPSLYLNDQTGGFEAPAGSRLTIRLYGEVGALQVEETVSNRDQDTSNADPEQSFEITKDGTLRIDGPGGGEWTVRATPDRLPVVTVLTDEAETTFDGQMSQPFEVQDDYGVVGGTATFRLDMAQLDRSHGLAIDPEPREEIVLDLPLPITGDRAEFRETLIENLSQHPWAHLPVTLEITVEDAIGQNGQSTREQMALPARRFFDPLAASIIEQRRDLLWSRQNAKRVSQVLRAVSHNPGETLFRSEAAYLRLRVTLRRLETLMHEDALTTEAQEEVAQALWDLAIILEDGDIGNALERMREAQERLSEAMRNGASEEEIARLMQELRDATQDYLRQRSQQAQRENEQFGENQELSENQQTLDQQDLQEMMDRIQELMEQGRFAEAEQALQEFQQMMENLRMAENQRGQNGENAGQQALEDLAETLRDQQGLSDQAFRDLQEQFNPNAEAGENQANEGRSGDQGRGETHEGQGAGRGNAQSGAQGNQEAQGRSNEGTLADRQEALRQELERQRRSLPGGGTETGDAARESLENAERAMRGAEEALRQDDLAEAIDRQAEAMEALRDGMRNLGEALAENQQNQGGQGQASGQFGEDQPDPLGRTPGQGAQVGTRDNLLQGEDVYRRARELLDEIRRRSGEGERPDIELEYLKRLLDRF